MTRANLVFTCAHVDDGRGWTRVSSFFSAVRVRELAFPGLTWGNSSDVNARQSVTLRRAAPSRAGRRVASFCLFFEESGAQHVAAACKWHMYTRLSPCISLLSSFPSDEHAGYVHLIHTDWSCGTTASIPAKKARILRQYQFDPRENNHSNLVGTACDGFTRRSLPEIRRSSEGRVLLHLKLLGDWSFFYFFFLFFSLRKLDLEWYTVFFELLHDGESCKTLNFMKRVIRLPMLVRSWEIWNLTNVLNARNIETFGNYAQEGASTLTLSETWDGRNSEVTAKRRWYLLE